MQSLPPIKCFSYVKTLTWIESYFGEDEKKWPALLVRLKETEKDLAINALGMAFAYLSDALIDDQIIIPGTFFEYEPA